MITAVSFDEDIEKSWKKYMSESQVHSLKTANRVRQEIQLDLLEARDQECLRCSKEFVSYQKDIKLCSNCRKRME